MAMPDAVPFDAPIPGQSLTAPLGGRPWQSPPQYATVEEALDYYIPRIDSDEVSSQLIDVMEMGIPVTTIANTMQLSGVLEGKHSVDVGMLILPVLTELLMLIGDTAKVKYTSGLEKGKELRGSLVDLAVQKFKDEQAKPEEDENISNEDSPIVQDMQEKAEERFSGLMARRI
jgi:hypothetical protein